MDEQIEKKSSNLSLWITGIVVALIVIALITNGFGLFNPKNPTTGGTITGTELYIGTSPVLGDANAKLTIYEFSDFSCPYCKIASQTIDPQLYNDYIKTGKVKIVFKYFKTHGQADPAHQVAYALADQNVSLFWQFKELAFADQADTNNLDAMKTTAQNLGANMTELNDFLTSNKATYLAAQDNQLAVSLGLQGTPTYVIGNKILMVSTYADMQKEIDSQLK